MYVPDPATTGSIVKTIADLFKRLRDHQNNKEVFDIVRDLQTEQSKLEAQIKEADAEVTRLREEMAHLKTAHAAEIAKLNEAHAQEIARRNSNPGRAIPWTEGDDDAGPFGHLGKML